MVDLGISPDLPAFWCYGVVVAVGGWVAGRQISVRLDSIPGVWLQWRTYLLFMLYTSLPDGLFWLLDRAAR